MVGSDPTTGPATFRAIFAGRRGRLLLALLLAELGTAVHSIAYSTVLPVASEELDGARLYGATLVAGSFAAIFVLSTGLGLFARMSAGRLLLVATAMFVFGVLLTVSAVTMWMVLAGMIVRGLAGGLLAGLGLTAIGALYEDDLRPRVLGLFAMIWLVPSLAGPLLNAAITVAFDWRTSMAWPAALVVAARVIIGRYTSMIPWNRSDSRRLEWQRGVALLAGLVLAAAAPASSGALGVALFVAGITVSVLVTLSILRRQVPDDRARLWTIAGLFGLTLAFFGGHEVIALSAIAGLGHGVVGGSVAVGAGLTAWSVTGMRRGGSRTRFGEATVLGLGMLAAALVGVGLVLLFGPLLGSLAALVLLIVCWGVGGLGMGLSYRQLMSEAMDDLPRDDVTFAAVALSFAELAGTAIGTLTSGGIYSLGSALGIGAEASLTGAYVLLGLAAAAGLAVCVLRPKRHRGADSGLPDSGVPGQGM